MKKALITGITGQDGSYLCELLLDKGYEVHGIIRRASSFNTQRIQHLFRDPHDEDVRLLLHYGDLCDGTGLRRIIEQVRPAEVYNLAAQSHVRVSFDQPEYTADVVAMGTLRLLEACRDYLKNRPAELRLYQAGTSEMFGNSPPPQNETTRFHARSPYAASKIAAYWHAVNYRDAYGMHVTNGLLFNHESPRRGETFVTRKITRALGRIKMGLQEKLYLGNLDGRRDWGFAPEYVHAMWQMLQQPAGDDYVIATGEAHSIREFLDTAAGVLDLRWQDHVEIDERYLRPTDVNDLRGDATKARETLGWQPKTHFPELVRTMVEADLDLARQERHMATYRKP